MLSPAVFRELLQNSDDASARAVEIHFETEAYLQRAKEGATAGADATNAVTPLPDLKTAVVCNHKIQSSFDCLTSASGDSMDLQERWHGIPRRGLEQAEEDRYDMLIVIVYVRNSLVLSRG